MKITQKRGIVYQNHSKTRDFVFKMMTFAETCMQILLASKKQNGKLSLRSAIARAKEPTDSTIGTGQ